MRFSVVRFLVIGFVTLGFWPGLLGAQSTSFGKAEELLQKGQYDEAIRELSLAGGSDQDYAAYLKALATFKANKVNEAEALCLEATGKFPKSKWLPKLTFLLADIYLKQKNYQAVEKIYADGAARLLSADRSKENAAIYVGLAERLSTIPKPEELDAPKPNFALAYAYYGEALQLEIAPELADSIKLKRAEVMVKARDFAKAAAEYREYLVNYDPDWVAPGRPKPTYVGRFGREARLGLAEALLRTGQNLAARQTFEDLVTRLKGKTGAEDQKTLRLALRRLPFTYGLPSPSSDFELDGGARAVADYLKAFPADSLACYEAWLRAQAYVYRGRTDEAIAALQEIFAKKNFTVPATETAEEKELREALGVTLSPEDQFAKYQKEALAQIGDLYFKQKNYAKAIQAFSDYISQFPNGTQWTTAQKGIVDAEYQIGVDRINDKKYAEADKVWTVFLQNHPLDPRARQIVFTLAQIQYQDGLDFKKSDRAKSQAALQNAVAAFRRLVSKYPETEEASLAQLAIGEIQERELGDFDGALKTYRALTWGSKASEASRRVGAMVNKELTLRTERVFRGNEKASVKIQARNIDKVKLSAYKLNLEAYFRKFHGVVGVDSLDLALIQPDQTWEVAFKGYRQYLPLEQDIEVPLNGPGVYAVNVASPELESTTLVIRSDIDVILKSSKKEVLVFVQDMLKNKGAANARVLITDGQKVLLESKTGADGVLRQSLPDLLGTTNVDAFVEIGGNVAVTGLSLSGLSVSSGLAPKGYIYTDKPAYKPGETVNIKGILREVVNGSFALPKGTFTVAVTDAAGKAILRQDQVVNDYGSLALSAVLSKQAAQGQYLITMSNKDQTRHFTGSFRVEDFKLEKIKLSLDFDRPLYFRGEKIKATVVAQYYFGQPVGNHDLQVTTPDGLVHDVTTDSAGRFSLDFDSSPYSPGQGLAFRAVLNGENVAATKLVTLASQEFVLRVAANRTVALAGTPTEFTIRAQDLVGNNLARDVEVSLVRRVSQGVDPLWIAAPWLGNRNAAQTYAEIQVDKKTVKTGADGIGRLTFAPAEGGNYLVRARAKDRFENLVTGEYGLFFSDDSDQVKLRLFANQETYKVGASDFVLLHSRFKGPSLALVCFEGEGILNYTILTIDRAETRIPFTIGNEHFPNFQIAVACLANTTMATASLPFNVERQLTIGVKPVKPIFEPKATAPVAITIKDHTGRPVSAEFSLALINEALLNRFGDAAPSIVSFFQDGARRSAPTRLASSAAFSYSPVTKAVNPELADEDRRVATLKPQPSAPAAKAAEQTRSSREEQEKRGLDGLASDADANGFYYRNERGSGVNGPISLALEDATETTIGGEKGPEARTELPSDSYWLAAVITDKDGQATVDLPLPSQTSAFQLAVKGVSKESLVGEGTASLTIRKDFFATIKVPALFQEGDQVRLIGQLHNVGTYAGPATATLTVIADGQATKLPALSLTLKTNETRDLLFAAYTVPAASKIQVRLDVQASATLADALVVDVPVRPWGLPIGVRQAGTAQDTVVVNAELPKDRAFQSTWMTVTLSPSVNESLIQRVLQPEIYTARDWMGVRVPFVSGPEVRLAALVAAYEYAAAKTNAPGAVVELRLQILAAISALVAGQKSDGSWSLNGGEEVAAVTAQAYWSLQRAAKAGLGVDTNTLNQAKTFLKNKFTALPQDENELKAMIQYALSFSGDADYSFVNRLYRSRNDLSEASLVFTALTLARLEKKDIGLELLPLLEAKAETINLGPGTARTAKRWNGTSNHPWLRNPTEATALALLAWETLKPQDPLVRQALAYLEGFDQGPAKAQGYVVDALAQFYGPTTLAASDLNVAVTVNDTAVGAIRLKSGQADAGQPVQILVPSNLIKTGANRVQFAYSGRGEYQYIVDLTGFTKDLTDPQSWTYPNIAAKKYIHEAIRYKGQNMGRSSMEIKELEMAQTAEVEISFNGGQRQGYLVLEDYLPAGAVLLKDSLQGNYSMVEFENSKILFYFKPDQYVSDIHYTLAAYTPGKFQILPPVIREVFSPAAMRLGKVGGLQVLASGEKSSEPYKMNADELFQLGKANFNDGNSNQALELLETLYARDSKSYQPDLARMLLWIRTEPAYFDGPKVVAYFEILKEKYPDLSIPFAKIMVVGKAYHDIKEYERSFLIYKAVVDSSFLKDSAIGGNLEDAGEVIGSIDYMTKLWGEYPDSPAVMNAWFALAQAVYADAPTAAKLNARGPDKAVWTTTDYLNKAAAMFWQFGSLYNDNELVDDAAFTMLSIALDRKDYERVIGLSQGYQKTFAKSEFFSNYQYSEALAQFWLRRYQAAIQVAKNVAAGTSDNKDLSTYILGQIYHAQRQPETALGYYKTVAAQFPDAAEAIRYFETKTIALEEVTTQVPGQKVNLAVKYRNIKEANLQVYKVDLMKLYLREKNLSKITKINLSGITPSIEKTIALGNGKDYADKETAVPLDLSEEGAYLVVCRGDDLFTSGLVLITPLSIEVQEDLNSQRVRVNIFDKVRQMYPDNVQVKVVGSNNNQVVAGDTDLRGIFVADGINGLTTVIARDQANRYAFYRGKDFLGAKTTRPTQQRNTNANEDFDTKYRGNDQRTLEKLQEANRANLDNLYKNKVDGVQVQQAK